MLQIAFIGALPKDAISGGLGQVHFDSPWAGLVSIVGIAWLVNLVLADSIISPSATGNIYLSATGRAIFAWAENGTFYKLFEKIGAHASVPRPALWLALIMAIIWTLPVQFQSWSGIISAATAAKALTYVVGPVSLITLRRAMPNMKRPFFLKGAMTISALAFIAATFIIYWSGWSDISLLMPLIIPVIIFYFAFVDKDPKFAGKVRGDMYSGYWLIGYFIFMFIMSFIGSYGPDSGQWIPAQWDTVAVAISSLVFFWWGIITALETPRLDEEDEESSAA